MGCIAILRRSLFRQDARLFRRAFESGLRATGSAMDGRRVKFLSGGNGAFHVMFQPRADALDCHAYAASRKVNLYTVKGRGPAYSAARKVLADTHAFICIEPDPVILTQTGRRRVASAVAELLDAKCVALIAISWGSAMKHRFAMCTPETPALLRSSDPRRAFKDGVELTLVSPQASD